MKTGAVILAAGDGKRMKSSRPKVMCEVLEKPMVGWVIDSLYEADFSADSIGVVVGNGAEIVSEYVGSAGVTHTGMQAERKGTGHAVMQAADMLDLCDNVLVLCGDAPFIDSDTIRNSLEAHISSESKVTVVTAEIENPTGYGRIIRDEKGNLLRITEQKDCSEQEKLIKEINSGVYWFDSKALKSALPRLQTANAAGEYYLTDVIGITLADKGKVSAFCADNPDIVLGANSRRDLLRLNTIARMSVIDKHLDNGVEFVCTDGIIIGKDVEIAQDCKILPNTILRGKTVIGAGSVIGPNSIIENCNIGEKAELDNVHAFNSVIENNVKAGPFVHLRPGTTLHDGVKIGDFVEVKNSEIGTMTCIAHLTYVGDSDVGKDVNFGCGCVTANYDGVNKFRTVIGDHAFIGCNTNLIAPVEIGENATTAAGSTITRNVPPDSLVIERGQPRTIENWEHNSKRKRKA